MRITIVFLIDLMLRGGGTENQLKTLIQYIDRNRFRPLLVTSRTEHDSFCEGIDCPIVHLGIGSLASFGSVAGIWRLRKLLKKERADLIQLFFIDSNIIGVIAAKLAGVKKIIVARRDLGLWYGWRHLKVTNFLNRFTHFCIANAEAIRDVVDNHETIPRDRIKVIYNGLDVAKSDRATPMASTELGVPEDSPVVGIVANLKTVKRIDRFIDMANKLSNTAAHFVIVGEGYLEKELKKKAAESPIADRIHFYYTTEQTMSVMKRFNVGVLTSESEGLSNVLIEYALNGVPAITFDTGGNQEVVRDGVTGFVVPAYDIDLLAKKVNFLLNSPPTSQEMGKEAASQARRRFSVGQMIKETEDFYLSILGQKTGAAVTAEPSSRLEQAS